MSETTLRFRVDVAVFGDPAQLEKMALELYRPATRRYIEFVIQDALFAGLRPQAPTLFIVSADRLSCLATTTHPIGGGKHEPAKGN